MKFKINTEHMPKLNANIPSFKAYVRRSHFTKKYEDRDEFYGVYVFGIQSVSGVVLLFIKRKSLWLKKSFSPFFVLLLKNMTFI